MLVSEILSGPLTTFAVEMGLEPRASQISLGLDSLVPAVVDRERQESRMEDEGAITEAPMHTVCKGVTHQLHPEGRLCARTTTGELYRAQGK